LADASTNTRIGTNPCLGGTPTNGPASGLHAKVQFPPVPGRAATDFLCRPAFPRNLQAATRLIRSRNGRSDDDRRADGAEHIGNGVGDGRQLSRALVTIRGLAKPVDGIGGPVPSRPKSSATRIKTGCIARS
jgi:hypothetical protein